MKNKLLLYIIGVIFLVITLFFIPDEIKIIHILLASGGILFFLNKIMTELRNKKDVR
jgi:VIT1/CCC1 family predicted Fe2+/Mn2+ transporter